MSKSYARPGRDQPKRRIGIGKFSPDRQVWTNLHNGSWILFSIDRRDDDQPDDSTDPDDLDDQPIWEEGPNTFVKFTPPHGRTGTRFSLTTLTEEELDAFGDFIQRSIEIARPIVQNRDRIAKEAMENGDDTFIRVYRAVPVVHDRTRSE